MVVRRTRFLLVLVALVLSVVAEARAREPIASDEPRLAPAELRRDTGEPTPQELEGVDIEEHLGVRVPLHLRFTNDRGEKVALGDIVGPDTPTILTFNYSKCPMLCSVQLGGLTEALAGLRRLPGVDFEIITVVLDPSETPHRASKTKAGYLGQLARAREAASLPAADRADDGWHFLVGDRATIRELADTVGFGYTFHPGRKEYLHPSTFMLLTPSGRVAQYAYGVHFEPTFLEGALASAAMDVTTESVQDFILSCYHYEPVEGADGFRVMQIGALAFAGLLVVVLAGLHLRSRLGAGTKRPAV